MCVFSCLKSKLLKTDLLRLFAELFSPLRSFFHCVDECIPMKKICFFSSLQKFDWSFGTYLKPPLSNSWTPCIVVPPGEQTWKRFCCQKKNSHPRTVQILSNLTFTLPHLLKQQDVCQLLKRFLQHLIESGPQTVWPFDGERLVWHYRRLTLRWSCTPKSKINFHNRRAYSEKCYFSIW